MANSYWHSHSCWFCCIFFFNFFWKQTIPKKTQHSWHNWSSPVPESLLWTQLQVTCLVRFPISKATFQSRNTRNPIVQLLRAPNQFKTFFSQNLVVFFTVYFKSLKIIKIHLQFLMLRIEGTWQEFTVLSFWRCLTFWKQLIGNFQ